MRDIQYYAIKFKGQMVFAYLRMRTRPSIEARLTAIETNGGNKSLFSHGTLSRVRKVTRFYGKTVNKGDLRCAFNWNQGQTEHLCFPVAG